MGGVNYFILIQNMLKICAYKENEIFSLWDIISNIFAFPVSLIFKRKFKITNVEGKISD